MYAKYDWATVSDDQEFPVPYMLQCGRGNNELPWLWWDGRGEADGLEINHIVNNFTPPGANYGSGANSPGQIYNVNITGSIVLDNGNGNQTFAFADIMTKVPISFYSPSFTSGGTGAIGDTSNMANYALGDESRDFRSVMFSKDSSPPVNQLPAMYIWATLQWRPGTSWYLIVGVYRNDYNLGIVGGATVWTSNTDSPISAKWTRVKSLGQVVTDSSSVTSVSF